ncbi:zinc-binding metallopeptidase family protein [Arthrobacter sedimenti]|uniref:zinc-binding metallopeptidase family protein n=1 Tax=Arthrobacter sedimenti TaxID=2694931 RepID=UPI000B34B327|nr:putative zinc-binding metallopeptidase [Arthrobacter sedimenti]OUM41748.1 hypothetical protein B8W73_08865 [Arthrobacter agilis]
MQRFACAVCGAPLFFENSQCLACGTQLGFHRGERAITPLDDDGAYRDLEGQILRRCTNLKLSGCTWLVREEGDECFSCNLTRSRPDDHDTTGLAQFLDAERSKRHLIYELDVLGLPIEDRVQNPERGLAFDLLSSVEEKVVIGHQNGLITIDLAETVDSHREKMRAKLEEPYRTMLGHFRHETGHYFEGTLVFSDPDLTERARSIFGDDRASYKDAIKRHYDEGAPEGWEKEHISQYATMHPYEDFAETFAHYLHICDTVDTALQYGLASGPGPNTSEDFGDVVRETWIPLSVALNQVNRSMGANDLYPFVLPPAVVAKLDFVHKLRVRVGEPVAGPAAV